MRKFILLIVVCGFGFARAQTIAPFKANDRIAFVGNSITDGGHYHSYIWLYYITHFPDMRITCYNAGIGGDAISQIYDRFDADVLGKQPNVITLTWGMNDTGYFEWYKPDGKDIMDQKINGSYGYYAQLEDKLKARADIRKIFILGSPYDETSKFTKNNLYPGKTAAFSKVIDYQEAAAKRNHWGVVDFYHPMQAINKREQAKDSTFSLTPNDRVHPDNDGHMVMAYLFLKTQGLAGRPVAEAGVNAQTKKVIKAVNCTISQVEANAHAVSFTYLAKSLPYPLDTVSRGWGNHKTQADALKLVPFTKEFNQELLTVKNLAEGRYTLLIDGERIRSFDAGQLSAGINMAELTNTPQYQQATAVRELNEERWDIERRLRQYVWMQYDFLKAKGKLNKDDMAAMDSVNKYAPKEPFVNGNKDNYTRARYKAVRDTWQQEIELLTSRMYTLSKPQSHRITLVASK